MEIPILIEKIKSNGYRASGGEPLALTAEGDTQEEALANLTLKLNARLRGRVVVAFELPAQVNPLGEFVGMFKGDPLIKDWKKSMKAHRRNRDKDADKP
jgi:hypothetical protein